MTLVNAQLASLERRNEEAEKLYHLAIEQATKCAMLNIVGYANEQAVVHCIFTNSLQLHLNHIH